MLCFLFSALIVALDQFFKQWVVRSIELGGEGAEIIPGILGLTRWENDGAMLNILSGQQWLLAGIAFVASVVLVMILLRYNEGFWGTIGLAAVLGGSVGNLVDRIFNEGRVIDMFRTLFINFPIFNIADIFITLGFITFLIHFIALTFKEDKKEAPARRAASSEGSESDIESFSVDILPSARTSSSDDQNAAPEQLAAAEPVEQYAATAMQPVAQEPVYAAQPTIAQQPAAPQEDLYVPLHGEYDAVEETTPDVSFTLESLEAELGSLDVDYDIDELLREYGIEDDDISL